MRKIYFNGNFITLEDKKDVNAILIEDGIIEKVDGKITGYLWYYYSTRRLFSERVD